MKKKVCALLISLTAALALSGCGGSPAAAAPTPEAEIPSPEATAPAPEPAESAAPEKGQKVSAVTDGELVYTLGADYMVLSAGGDNGWFTASWLDKGYGTEYVAVNSATGQEIKGEEGAEVVLCKNAVAQFVWRDAGGTQLSVDDMYLYIGDSPREGTLYAVIYDFDGAVSEERELLTMPQTDDDPYYSIVYPLMEQVIAELGGGSAAGESLMLTVEDDGGDAVVTDGASELIRIPGADADMTYAFSAGNGRLISVSRPDTGETEFYSFGA